jgi:CheY-like chemotaxis protein
MARILMVDDDPIITQIYSGLFERDGYKVDIAPSGHKALEKLAILPPDILLLDVGLPGMDGLEVLSQVRAHQNTANLPVLVFSNSFVQDTTDDELKKGPTRFLTKSECTPEQLLKEVHELFIEALAKDPSVQAPSKSDQVSDTAFYRREITQHFLGKSSTIINTLRFKWQSFVKSETDSERVTLLQDLARTTHSLSGHSSIAGFNRISQISSAFEALLLEIREDPFNMNASTHRTMAHAVDYLVHLMESASEKSASVSLYGVVLAVDDEATSLWAVCSALELAQLRPIAINNPEIALAVLKDNKFDLILLDVEMPGKNGYDTCKELRTFSSNKTTPVVFVTGLSDFSSRAKSSLSGGNDFIAKPFLLSELAVKALILLYKSREEGLKK